MQLVCIAGYCLNCSFNRDDRNTRKCNVPVAYFDGLTQSTNGCAWNEIERNLFFCCRNRSVGTEL